MVDDTLDLQKQEILLRMAENIIQYIKIVEEVKNENIKKKNKAELLFRGQSVDKPLLPKLARLEIEKLLNGEILNIEKLILEEFERGILPLSEFQPQNQWDLIALAQHHGLPTRLLDWTYSALVALWFVVQKPAKEKKDKMEFEDGIVWILAADTEDFRLNTKITTPFDESPTKIFRSKVITRRISAQAGVFTVHKVDETGKIIRLETHKTFKEKLIKVIIPASAFASLRKELNVLGVNHSTTYPDIDGFCKHLTWRFSKYRDELN